MTTLNMHKAPKGIFEKTMLQNMFRFCDPEECFKSFRLVCKPWQNAIETIQFDRTSDDLIDRIDRAFSHNPNLVTTYFEKYFPVFKKLTMFPDLLRNKDETFSLVLNNVNKLNDIRVTFIGELTQQDNSFVLALIEKSQKTLHTLNVPQFIGLDLDLPNLKKLTLNIERGIELSEFQTKFPQICQNFANLDCVELHTVIWQESKNIFQYVREHYLRHCVSITLGQNSCLVELLGLGHIPHILDFMPFKIVENIRNLNDLESQYVSQIQHIHVNINAVYDRPFESGWDRYQEIFDQCANLQAIEITEGGKSIDQILLDLSETNQNIWKERIAYFQTRTIRVVNWCEITNETLREKVAKEAGIKWRFHIRC
jgi:hypothetical protein